MDKATPPEIETSLKRFDRQSTILQVLYVLLGICAITAPILVAGLTDLLGSFTTKIVSLIGALAVGLIGGFRLSEKGNEMRRAYLDLRAAILKYKYDPNADVAVLVEAYSAINKTIGAIEGPGSKEVELVAKDH